MHPGTFTLKIVNWADPMAINSFAISTVAKDEVAFIPVGQILASKMVNAELKAPKEIVRKSQEGGSILA